MRLIFMGPPGAGKGTQGQLLAEHLGIPRLSTGEMLRAARTDGTELGRRARRYMDAGELVPDDLILGMVAEALDGPRPPPGFVLDGFPRTIPQAEGLSEILDGRETRLDAVVFLRVPQEELVSRLTGRSALEDRTDDDPETVRRRIEVYRDETEPLIRWYRESGVNVVEADGIGSIEEVQQNLRQGLGL